MTPNQYTDTYKRLPDEKLIEILDNKKDYQPLAIETALFELQKRQLSEAQIVQAREINAESKSRRSLSDRKIQEKVDFAKNTADKALTIFDPLVEKTPDRTIKLISLALGLFSIIKIVYNFSFIRFLFEDGEWDFSVAIFLFDILFLPVTAVLFWQRKKSGRILLMVWLIYNIASALVLLYTVFALDGSDSLLSFMLPQADITTFFIVVMLSVGLLVYINKKDVRTLFE